MPRTQFLSLPQSYFIEPKIIFAIVVIFITWGKSSITNAQIVPDNSLPKNSTVTTNNESAEINGGTVRGTNLFHSFSEFSLNPPNLPNGIDTAYFNNPNDITSIFSRVTGNSISHINGLIKSNGSADLFFINPNGIIFGENAVLDIGGSFISSTAGSIRFADNQEFNATDPTENPLLSVNMPIGLQYGDRSEAISVMGKGNNTNVENNDHTLGLTVEGDNTLALIGGDIFLSGSNLTVDAGNVVLGSVRENQNIAVNPDARGWTFNYDSVNNFGEINLSAAASINANGDIWLQGDLITLQEESIIQSDTLIDGISGSLNITAQDLKIKGINSGLFSTVKENATGNGANINLKLDRLTIQDGGQIALETLGLGKGGNLDIQARKIDLSDRHSGIFSRAMVDTGNGGDIAISTKRLAIQDGAKIYAGNFSSTILQNDDSNLIKPLSTTTIAPINLAYSIIGTGEAGNIEINTNSIILESQNIEQSSIATSTFAKGGGIIKLTADTISLRQSQITTEARGESAGGDIYIDTHSLYLNEGGTVVGSTYGAGNGGNISIKTSQELIDNGENSGIFSQVDGNATGNPGKINIVSPKTAFEPNFKEFSSQVVDSQFEHPRNLKSAQQIDIQIPRGEINVSTDKFIISAKKITNQVASREFAPWIKEAESSKIDNPRNLLVSYCLVQDMFLKPLPELKSNFANFNRARNNVSNSLNEATSWTINSVGKIELLADYCI